MIPAKLRPGDEVRVVSPAVSLGGYNSNQLLDYLDCDLIGANPRTFCGFSDITALATATHARTGLVTYSGPHFTTFGMKLGIGYTSAGNGVVALHIDEH
jgi:muramoyltetrapeptide carboxypeptidase LdcA involved in peptidoglycan recycling